MSRRARERGEKHDRWQDERDEDDDEADQVLRDCMDIATATGMRLTDARTVRMPVGGVLRHKSGKTGKWVEFDVSLSPVLSALVARREASKAHCTMLLATDTGRQVTQNPPPQGVPVRFRPRAPHNQCVCRYIIRSVQIRMREIFRIVGAKAHIQGPAASRVGAFFFACVATSATHRAARQPSLGNPHTSER